MCLYIDVMNIILKESELNYEYKNIYLIFTSFIIIESFLIHMDELMCFSLVIDIYSKKVQNNLLKDALEL